MKKNLILWMSALFLVISGMVSCSSDDDDEVKLSAEDLIGTRTCVGTVGYHGDSKGEWGTILFHRFKGNKSKVNDRYHIGVTNTVIWKLHSKNTTKSLEIIRIIPTFADAI